MSYVFPVYVEFNMAAGEPEVVITNVVLWLEMSFQKLLPCSQGSTTRWYSARRLFLKQLGCIQHGGRQTGSSCNLRCIIARNVIPEVSTRVSGVPRVPTSNSVKYWQDFLHWWLKGITANIFRHIWVICHVTNSMWRPPNRKYLYLWFYIRFQWNSKGYTHVSMVNRCNGMHLDVVCVSGVRRIQYGGRRTGSSYN